MAVITKDLGAVSAYAVAVENGFTGTETEWEQYIANASINAQNAAGSATAAAASAASAAQSATSADVSKVAAAGSAVDAENYALVAGNHAAAASVSASAAQTAKTDAETAKTAAQAAQAEAEAVVESIPPDYTELSDSVSSLKSAINQEAATKYDLILDSFTQETVTRTWASGTISTSTGGNVSSTTRIRTNGFLAVPAKSVLKIVIPAALKINIFSYTTDASSGFTGTSGYVTGTVEKYYSDAVYLRFIAAYAADDTQDIAASAGDGIAFYQYAGIAIPIVDTALTTAGGAADAKVVGDTFAEISGEAYDRQPVNQCYFSQGTFTQGAPMDSTTRIRSFGKLHDSVVKIEAADGYEFTIQAFLKSNNGWRGSLKANDVISQEGTTIWVTDFDVLKFNAKYPDYYWRVLARRGDQGDITPAESVNIFYTVNPRKLSGAIAPNTRVISTAAEYYDMFDVFVTDGFATKETIATVNDLPIYKYHFSGLTKWAEGSANQEHAGNDRLFDKFQILFTSGMHGDEKGSPLYLYNFMHNICYNPDYSKHLALCDFYVIPICNPTGYNANTRNNYQDININRIDESGETVEAQAIMAVVDAQHYDLYIDCHNCCTDKSASSYPRVAGVMSFANDTPSELMTKCYRTYIKVGADVLKKVLNQYGMEDDNIKQSFLPWQGTTNQTFRNYAYEHSVGGNVVGAKVSACFEASRWCWSLSGSTTEYNGAALVIGNTLLDGVCNEFLQKVFDYIL